MYPYRFAPNSSVYHDLTLVYCMSGRSPNQTNRYESHVATVGRKNTFLKENVQQSQAQEAQPSEPTRLG